MKKKFILMLPCVVSVAFAALVSMKTFESNALGTDTLLAQDVEALSQDDSGSFLFHVIDQVYNVVIMQ